MSYTPNTWQTGDTITAAKLNNMEQGIADASGGSVLPVFEDSETGTLDKTWQQIHDATFPVIMGSYGDYFRSFSLIVECNENSGVFSVVTAGPSPNPNTGMVEFSTNTYSTNSASGYPSAI